MLGIIYGKIELKPKFEGVSVLFEQYEGKRFFKSLSRIYIALTKYRGYTDFIHSKTLNRSDIYIPKKKILIETDEFQHFTEARLIALKNYPQSLSPSYNIKAYKKMCKKLNQKDRDPKYRDEQRAWYDSIRDFLPKICPDKVTKVIRIPLGEYEWCSLDPKDPNDIKKFKKLLKSDEIWRR